MTYVWVILFLWVLLSVPLGVVIVEMMQVRQAPAPKAKDNEPADQGRME